MRKLFTVILFSIIILIPFSCEDMALIIDCNDCFTERPIEENLEIDVTINNENPFVPITIFLGDIEDGIIIKEDLAYYKHYYKIAKVGEYYSVLAKYQNNGRTINVVDGKMLRAKRDESSCDNACYIILGKNLDVRLK